jgi:hypothetical protein
MLAGVCKRSVASGHGVWELESAPESGSDIPYSASQSCKQKHENMETIDDDNHEHQN